MERQQWEYQHWIEHIVHRQMELLKKMIRRQIEALNILTQHDEFSENSITNHCDPIIGWP